MMKQLFTVTALAGLGLASPAMAATTSTYAMAGSVTAICTVAAAGTTLSFGTLTDSTGVTSVQTANPFQADGTAFCNQAKTTVLVQRTNLISSALPSSGFTNTLLITNAKVVSPQNATGITDISALAGAGTSAGTSGTLGAFNILTVSALAGAASGGLSLVAGTVAAGTAYAGTVTITLTPTS